LRQKQVEQLILATLASPRPQGLVIAANFEHAAAAQEWRTAVADEIIEHEERIDVAAVIGNVRRSRENMPGLVDPQRPSVHHADLRTGFTHRGDLPSDLLGMPDIIGIERRDEFAAGAFDADVARRSDAAIRLSQELYAPIDGGDSLDDRRGPVGRAVVDHDDFQIAI